MIRSPSANAWAVIIVAREDGVITVQPIEAPLEIHQLIVDALKTRARVAPPELVSG